MTRRTNDVQWNNLLLGRRIRMICGINSQRSNLDVDLAARINAACAEQMHRLGYESDEERSERLYKIINSGGTITKEDARHQKKED